MNQRQGLAPVIFALIITLLAGVWYVAWRNYQSPTTNNQPQNTEVVSMPSDWKTYHNEKYGFEFMYPNDWKQTSIFSSLGGYEDSIAFSPSVKEAKLQKALRPDTDIGAVVMQGSAIFLRPIADEDLFINLEKNRALLKTSEKTIDGKIIPYLFHSEKTDPNKFGGGSTELYVFKEQGFVIEANYPNAEPSGELKIIFEQILSTFKFMK